jgi:uncharacterized membrane protein YeaQ/YmgE (transglycosylase-associated protein family)
MSFAVDDQLTWERSMESSGPFCFGLVIGWVTYRTLRRRAGSAALGDIAAVIGAVGGATVVGLFKNVSFDSYCVGLAVGFFAYLIFAIVLQCFGPKAETKPEAGAGSKTDTSANPGKWMRADRDEF